MQAGLAEVSIHMNSPKTLLKAWGLRPRKSMGQNFLTDPAVAASILDGSQFGETDSVLEIGSGLGALTIPLTRRVKQVFAVEPDRQIAKLLRTELLASGVTNVEVIEEDILSCNIADLSTSAGGSLKVIGNLPYHISSQVVVYLVKHRRYVSRAVLMFQKEVARRLLAEPGTKAYGRLSVLLGYCSRAGLLIDVPASSFYPKPNVDSAVVTIDFLDALPFSATDESLLFALVQAGFGRRRKMLKNALKAKRLDISTRRLESAFRDSEIDERRRAETLRVEEFVHLSNTLTNKQQSNRK